MIEAPMLIFMNSSSNYPIRGLEDNIPGVYYRMGPKGWMDQWMLLYVSDLPYNTLVLEIKFSVTYFSRANDI